MEKKHAIAIDGPAGAGKSTIAKAVSAKLGFIYVDTGAMFRAMALGFLRAGIPADDENAISAAAEKADIAIRYENGVQQVLLNGENVSGLIRTEEVGNMASSVSIYPQVRKKLLELQRKIASENDVVMDGRDIGTVILPDADTKIFLTASARVRAARRYAELAEKGISCNLDDIVREMEERDYRDTHRDNAPLRKADDAVEVDTSELSVDEVIAAILSLAAGKKGGSPCGN